MEILKLYIIMETAIKEKSKEIIKVGGEHITITMDKSIVGYLLKIKSMVMVDTIFSLELSMKEIGVVA